MIRPGLILAGLLTPGSPDSARTIDISAYDSLHFSVREIDAHPGERLHVVFHNQGSLPKTVMGHNWVLLRSGIDSMSYASHAQSAKSEGYEPASLSDQVLAVVPLVGGGESSDITFTAPTQPGSYAFLCSSPGHCAAGMRGELVVK
jgi:azurin